MCRTRTRTRTKLTRSIPDRYNAGSVKTPRNEDARPASWIQVGMGTSYVLFGCACAYFAAPSLTILGIFQFYFSRASSLIVRSKGGERSKINYSDSRRATKKPSRPSPLFLLACACACAYAAASSLTPLGRIQLFFNFSLSVPLPPVLRSKGRVLGNLTILRICDVQQKNRRRLELSPQPA